MKQRRKFLLCLCCYLAILAAMQMTYDLNLCRENFYLFASFLLGGKLWILTTFLGLACLFVGICFLIANLLL